MTPSAGRRLTVYGATGYTGRLCAAEATRQGATLIVAGRDRLALDHLAAEVAADEVVVADARDAGSLASLAEAGGVLISTVGPFVELGRPVLQAAVAAGAGYVDVSGELRFLEWAYEQSTRAAEAGTTLAPGAGFDGTPGDLLAAVALDELPGPATTVRVAYLFQRSRPSAGTARTGIGMAGHGGAAVVGGRLVSEPVAAARWVADFGRPVGRRGVVSFPAPELVHLPRSTGAQTVRAFVAVPASRAISAAAAPLTAAARLVTSPPVRPLLERMVSSLPEGPSERVRRASRVRAMVEVSGPGGTRVARGLFHDLYGTTARVAVMVALRIAAGGAPVGACTPAQLLDAAAALDAIALRWDVATR